MAVYAVLKNLDDWCDQRVSSGVDFMITKHTTIKKELKNRGEDTIYSKRYGTSWEDHDAFQELYSCYCGDIRGKFKTGVVCPRCHDRVKYTGNDVNTTGWLRIEGSKIFHPNLYAYLESIIGKDEIANIIKSPMADINGHIVMPTTGYHKIGMSEFVKRWKEILEYYVKKKPNKKHLFEHVIKNKDMLLTSSIPVFSLIMRPIHASNAIFSSPANTIYNVLSKDVREFNSKKFMTFLEKEDKLEEIQLYFNQIYGYCLKSIAQKEGHIRSSMMGARFNSSTRTVIVPLDDGCDIDEIELPYLAFLEVYKLEIIGFLKSTRNIRHNEALRIWKDATFEFSQEVYNIIMSMIKNTEGGVKYVINRNPSIRYGSILLMRVRFVEPNIDNYVMKIPLQVLAFLNADFDGDALNGISIKSKDILEALEVNNPKYAMVISRNNGLLSADAFLIKDQVTILSDLCNLPYRIARQRKKLRMEEKR
ncbi:MAG: hypothetical protein ACRCXX_04000 [Cetobacterium sp.]|uniref:hypothetical protein n=1 Tax=Cetobacterium sp. TaxID=2071632 RepID=UPI003F3BC624